MSTPLIPEPVFTVKGTGTRACVLADGIRVTFWSGLEKAWRRRNEIEAAGTYKNRKCLSCPTVFLSEGAHHRMCDPCRRKSTSAYSVAV